MRAISSPLWLVGLEQIGTAQRLDAERRTENKIFRQTAVAPIWKAFALQPHCTETFKLSKDPLLIEKVRDIVGLDLHPLARAASLRRREEPDASSRPQRDAVADATRASRESGTRLRTARRRCLPRWMSAPGASVIGHRHAWHRAIERRKFLDRIDAAVPRGLDLHLILDNHVTHKTSLIHRWLANRPRYPLHFTPTSASWLNLVERRFVELARKELQRGVHRSTPALVVAIRR